MKDPVRIIVFTQEMECQFCKEARQLAEEAASLVPDKIKAEIYDLVKNTDKAKEYDVDKVPAIAIVGTKDYGIRYYGVPYGYEFNPFIDKLALTCPYCPIAAGLAHKFAIESNNVKSDVIEVSEFPVCGAKVQRYGCAENSNKRTNRTGGRGSRSPVCSSNTADSKTTKHICAVQAVG